MPDFGAMQPFMDRVATLYHGGVNAVEHPIDTMKEMLTPLAPESEHDKAIGQMNKQANDKTVQDVNEGFRRNARK